MAVLRKSFEDRLKGNLHASKVVFWDWLESQAADTNLFQPGNFISLVRVAETFINGLAGLNEEEFSKLNSRNSKLAVYTVITKGNVLLSKISFISQEVIWNRKKKSKRNCQLKSPKGECCKGDLNESKFTTSTPTILFLALQDICNENIKVSKSITVNSTCYTLAAISYCKEDHYFCEILVNHENYTPGWYIYDGLRNRGCTTFLGNHPVVSSTQFIEMLVYEQVPAKCDVNSLLKEGSCSPEEVSYSDDDKQLVRCQRAMVHLPSFEQLALNGICMQKGCNQTVFHVSSESRGVDVIMKLTCAVGHVNTWSSSPWYYGRLSNNASALLRSAANNDYGEHVPVRVTLVDVSKNDPQFAGIFHSLDVWHKAKKLTAKLSEAAAKTVNKSLDKWIAAIRNHFWYSCENCDGSEEKLKNLWMGIVHHVQGHYEWIGGQCEHDKMIDAVGEKEWLKPDDPALEAIREIVLDHNWLSTLHFYIHSQHTGALETIHSLMLMYCPKHIGENSA
eukprot:Seg1614.15 transcript_id=Seg1614.15/GoldUCD/mRNA.D3Y31 product="hypothetical protein" protein_id=Seg1614.15/GoldUCD/D3Y31